MEDAKPIIPLSQKFQQSDIDRLTNNLRDFPEIRITKDRGFFGITLPLTRCMEGATPQTAANYTTPFFIANRFYQVITVTERHQVAGSDGGAVTVTVNKVPSGTAPASGTAVITTPLSLKTTADTNQSGIVSTVQGVAILAPTDALCLISSGTLTAVVGVTVSVLLKAI